MSSRELLTLLEGLPAESWLKETLAADMRRAKVDAERAEMLAAHQDVQDRLSGRIRSPYEMSMSVVEKHAPGSELR